VVLPARDRAVRDRLLDPDAGLAVRRDYTKGLLGSSDRPRARACGAPARSRGRTGSSRSRRPPIAQLLADPRRWTRARGRRALFGDNCAACHGVDGHGGKGFPNLADRDWLWGGEARDVAETIRVGVNSTHPNTRVSEMIGFGAAGFSTRPRCPT
jgi:cytochrome c oxidase cbb3-type subunit 3